MKDNVTDCFCADELTSTLSAFQQKRPESVIYQTSLMSALLSGVYEGSTTIGDLLKKGDFGLGTFNHLDGELIAFDREVYQLRADGSANKARHDQRTPFAVITFFNPQYQHRFSHPASRDEVHQVINQQISSDNQFCALRLEGHFVQVDTRTVPCQHRPYKPMMQAVEEQPTFHFNQRNGVLIGFRSPRYMQGINVAGYHEHFITADRQGGGHVLDYQLQQGTLTFGEISKLVIDLPDDEDFLNANLNPTDLDDAIRSVES
ncbi:acetolactate decarboxylase [Erwinia toletana]|uniref:Alpha-acetolactate decarboxylase n=1 Tax=Winslowiella toletana TaxID=92490 RepID=A0ABS4P8T1_9GAMM|nr:acetolactate decarboxylase [Winslowiella toletana]MBP2169043.1 acetolactate decarboxylase [Winslowiella toletana]